MILKVFKFNIHVSLLLAIFLIVILQTLISTDSKASDIPKRIAPIQLNALTERNYWSGLIDRYGAEQSYKEFKSEYQGQNLGSQHAVAHIVGELLYEKLGLKGLTVCDETSTYGCYHGFFSKVLSTDGLSKVVSLDKVCLDKFGSLAAACEHGIGHGIMAYLDRRQLVQALDTCRKTTQPDPLNGCTAGVFMEYNISSHSSIQTGRNDVRTLNPSNPLEPCNTIVPSEFRQSCYFEIGLWWKEVFNADFAKIGRLCLGISDPDQNSDCYRGIGVVIAPTTKYSPNETTRLCQEMPSVEGTYGCLLGSYLVFRNQTDPASANKICERMAERDKQVCSKN